MSRGYNAKRKAKRQQARASSARPPEPRSSRPRQLVPLLPALIIVVVLGVVAFLGLGSKKEEGNSRQGVARRVEALLRGVPQDGVTLGSSTAPITLWMFADLECPTVQRFVEIHFPSIVETWVRDGTLKIKYRSLETDTFNEGTFFEQETAALAAGKQDTMWDFVLTFLYEQGKEDTEYATDGFLAGIASQVPGLKLRQWRKDREGALLSKRVALGVYTAHVNGMRSTPSFVVTLGNGKADEQEPSNGIDAAKEELERSLRKAIKELSEEKLGDVPALSPVLVGG